MTKIRICWFVRPGLSDFLITYADPLDDGVNTVKTICNDGRMVPGAGSTEIEMAKQIKAFANTCPGLEQYSIKKFGEALEVVPKILAENSGQLATEVLSQLYAAHAKGEAAVGVNVSVSGAAAERRRNKQMFACVSHKKNMLR